MALRRNILETATSLYVNRWWSGLFTNKSPLFQPVSALGLQLLIRHDTLCDGLNMEVTPQMTLARRPGFPRYCSQALASGEYPLAFHSFKNTSGTINLLVDTPTRVASFTTSVITTLLTKGTKNQTSFQTVGDFVFFCDGTNQKKFDGATVTNLGLPTPQTVAAVSNVSITNPNPAWAANTFYSTSLLVLDNKTPQHIWKLTTPGTTGSTQPTWASSPMTDGSAQWTDQGVSGWQANRAYTSGQFVSATVTQTTTYITYQFVKGAGYGGSTVPVTNTVTRTYNRFFQCTTSGTSGSSAPSFVLNGTGTDGTAAWTDVGNSYSWGTVGATTLVATAQVIADANGNNQTVNVSGKSGGSAPTWNKTVNGATADSGPSYTDGSLNYSLSWANGGQPYGPQVANTGAWEYVYSWRNSKTGHVGTSSAPSAPIVLSALSNIQVSGPSPTDTQIDTVRIYRSQQSDFSKFYYLSDVSVTPNAGGWTFVDSTTDSGLTITTLAPIAHANDAPPSTGSLLTFHAGRLWMAAGKNVYFAAGPDATEGLGTEAWPPANVFTFPGNVTALVSTPAGLLVSASGNQYIILGADLLSFYPLRYLKNFGISSPNSIAEDADMIFAFTSRKQLYGMSENLEDVGNQIQDQLQAFSPTSIYLALHRNGPDSGLFVSDGATNLYRHVISTNSWCPVAQPIGGVGAIASVEVAEGDYRLLIGQPTGGLILQRDTTGTVFQDNGTSYSAYATIGSLVLSPPGQMTTVEAIFLERTPVGNDALVYVLPDEISGTFTLLPFPRSEPVNLPPSTSIIAKRYYWKAAQKPVPQQLRHLRVKVSFLPENFKSEILGFGLD